MINVLLAVDMSPCSDAAVAAVIAQFAPATTKVRVLHAANWEAQLPPSYLFAEGASAARDVFAARDATVRTAQQYAAGIEQRLHAAGFDATSDVIAEGDPREAILDAAERWPADLIVMGSHGRTGLDKFLLGSVSERVVRHAPCSVQVVRQHHQHDQETKSTVQT